MVKRQSAFSGARCGKWGRYSSILLVSQILEARVFLLQVKSDKNALTGIIIKSFASPQAPGSSRIEEPRVVFPIPTDVLEVAILSSIDLFAEGIIRFVLSSLLW